MDKVDVVVIGAGVVGLAIAARFSQQHKQVLIIDRHEQVGEETSSRNSEVIHAGIYYPKGSLKAQLCVEGKTLLYEHCQQYKVAYKAVGKCIVAVTQQEQSELNSIQLKAQENGVLDLEPLSRKQLNNLEPNLNAYGGLLSPSTGIIDSHGYMQSLLWQVQQAGSYFVGNSKFIHAEKNSSGFTLTIKNCQDNTHSQIGCDLLINSAGLHAQECAQHIEGVDQAAIPELFYCRGHYFTYQGASPFQHLIYPVPEKNTSGLGIHSTLDLAGQIKFGPDVQYIDHLDYRFSNKDQQVLKNKFLNAITRYWPQIDPKKLQTGYTGIRPKIQGPNQAFKDFAIHDQSQHSVAGLVNLFGIESPGLTSSLAIADYVYQKAAC
jgi:L-2-hydroxyglutarate oxidase LhgO